MKITKNEKHREIAFQRDVLGLIAAKSSQKEKPVDIDRALTFPLAPIPLSLATPDGNRRKTPKNKLMDVLTSSINDCPEIRNDAVYMLDLIAFLQSLVKPPATFRDLAKRVVTSVPAMYKVVYIVCDQYDKPTIKSAEQEMRGQSEQYATIKPDMKLQDLGNFLKNGTNKENTMAVIEQVAIEERSKLLRPGRTFYIARTNQCTMISRDLVESKPELNSDHMEADTKFVYLTNHALHENNNNPTQCVIRSCSGDIDIPIILLAHIRPNLQIIIDNGTGKSRKFLDLNKCELSELERQALLGFHAFTGSDYTSSFFRKGKLNLWQKYVSGKTGKLHVLASIGQDDYINLVPDLEKLVVQFYNLRCGDINKACSEIFWSNFGRGRIPDLSCLPPCKTSLLLHIKRSHYVSMIWRLAHHPILNLESPEKYGWTRELDIQWVDEPFPDDVSDLLMGICEGAEVEPELEALDSEMEESESSDEIEECDDIYEYL